MSDTAVAVLMLPVLAVLVLVLECSRIGCTRLVNHLRRTATNPQPRSTTNA